MWDIGASKSLKIAQPNEKQQQQIQRNKLFALSRARSHTTTSHIHEHI